MRVPQVNERVKEAPAHALRAMFAGIGQLLSVSDKIRGKSASAPAGAETPETVAPETVAPETVAPETVAPETVAPETVAPETVAPETVAAETATPETVAPETVAPETVAPETVAPETVAPETAEPETVAPETVAPETVVAATATPETVAPETVAAKTVAPEAEPAAAGAALPLPNYDELTIASLRARLRNLSAGQLGELIEYEKAHAARADVISMFERRIAKLAEG
jgi:hypothetical protein